MVAGRDEAQSALSGQTKVVWIVKYALHTDGLLVSIINKLIDVAGTSEAAAEDATDTHPAT